MGYTNIKFFYWLEEICLCRGIKLSKSQVKNMSMYGENGLEIRTDSDVYHILVRKSDISYIKYNIDGTWLI